MISLDHRLEVLKAALVDEGDPIDVDAFATQINAANGSISDALLAWENRTASTESTLESSTESAAPPPTTSAGISSLRLVNSLVDVTDGHVGLVNAIRKSVPGATTLRQVTLAVGKSELDSILRSTDLAGDTIAATGTDDSHSPAAANVSSPPTSALQLRRNLFKLERTAVVQKMLVDDEIPVTAATHLHTILDENPSFDISVTPVATLLEHSEAFKSLGEDEKAAVETEFKTLQRVQALAPVPDIIPTLFTHNLTSALQISAIPGDSFVRGFQGEFGDASIAASVHRHATASRARNEQFLVSALQTVRGTGLRVIDGGNAKVNVEKRIASFNTTAAKMAKTQVDLQKLFGTLDYCECSDCNAVTSPAAYFVDLMEFLRHGNLRPGNTHVGAKTLKGTQLEQLLLRRPDLQCIQLTCENTNTVLPYIDLALEVMESYVVHAPQITAYNVNGETSGELLAEPHHTNSEAYEYLRKAVYPLALPYNFAIDCMRVFLSFLKTSRAEMLRIFRPLAGSSGDASSEKAVQRAIDAEFLLFTQEEYVILTHQAFVPPTSSGSCSSGCQCNRCQASRCKYNDKIGLRDPWEYFGYKCREDLLDDDPDTKTGLTWAKAQFLPRTGVFYTDLVALLKTRTINPNMPTGKALATMLKLRFSYRFLMYLVHTKYRDKKRRFSTLIKFLNYAQKLIPFLEQAAAAIAQDPCAGEGSGSSSSCGRDKHTDHCSCHCSCESDWRDWVYNWFEKVGKVIVLDSGEGPRLPRGGLLWAERRLSLAAAASQPLAEHGTTEADVSERFIGELRIDGGVIKDGEAVAFVAPDGRVIDINTGKGITETFPRLDISLYASEEDRLQGYRVGYVTSEEDVLFFFSLNSERRVRARYSSTQDTCDIEKVQIVHLDGSPVEPEEYERMMRFMRLWKKMGWTIEETDTAIVGLNKTTQVAADDEDDEDDEDNMTDGCEREQTPGAVANVDDPHLGDMVALLHQLVAVRKLIDITGFSVTVLLTFWADMPFGGENSLYSKTFLTHNLVRMDPVFQLDANGQPLTGDAKITDHLPVLMAVLRLKADEIALIRQGRDIPDALTLANVSELYRFSQLFRFMGIKMQFLPDFIALFGDPFANGNAEATLNLLYTWQKVVDSGFAFAQLNFLVRGQDNIARPLAPTIPQILTLAKKITDGLLDIDKQHPDVAQTDLDNQVVVLADFIPAQLALVFAPDLAAKINDLLSGKYLFTTDAPRGLILTGTPPDKVKYVAQTTATPPTAQLAVTGILTAAEYESTLALSAHPQWPKALERIKKQAVTFYNQNLASIFPPDGAETLLQGDTPDTVVTKGLYFLRYYLPFLRSRLATLLVQTTVSDSVGLDLKLASYLLVSVTSNSGKKALDELLALKPSSGRPSQPGWKGFLIPPSIDAFTFQVTSDDADPPPIVLAGKRVPFPHQSEDPSNIWTSDPVNLVAGTLYDLQLTGIDPESLSWRTATSPPAPIPATALLPALATDSVRDVLTKLARASLLIRGFSLSLDEVAYFHEHGGDFASADDNKALQIDAITLGTWKRLQAYTGLRDKLPKQPMQLIDLFSWAGLPDSGDPIDEINKVTLWDKDKTRAILSGFNALAANNFKDEQVLVRVAEALTFVSKTQIDIPSLFTWAKPVSLSDKAYAKLEDQANVLKKALQARYSATEWEGAARPLFDTLRKNQRDGLVAYLLVDEALVATGMVTDADSLFEYFLIDCLMGACLETSRIKQAIATIQLYVQRCLLGLETEVGTKQEDLLSRERWDWMKRYRVWEANRQVYLYPENWIVPSLRDDKSPFYLDFESSIQQKDVSLSNVAESLKEYVYNLAYVANMKVYGLFVLNQPSETVTPAALLAARRMNAPFDWYTREYTAARTWTPWVKMPVDIPNYDPDDENGNSQGSGSYVSPAMWQGHPIIFFLQMVQKQVPRPDDHTKSSMQRLNEDDPSTNKPQPMNELRLGFTMYKNGKWTSKQLSQDSLRHKARLFLVPDPKTATLPEDQRRQIQKYPPPDQSGYQMYPRTISDSEIRVDIVHRDALLDSGAGQTSPQSYNIGYFTFIDGSVAYAINGYGGNTIPVQTNFQYAFTGEGKAEMHSFQVADAAAQPPLFSQMPLVRYDKQPGPASKSSILLTNSSKYVFNHTFVDRLQKHINPVNSAKAVKDLYVQFAALSADADSAGDDPFGHTRDGYNELVSPYALYNWELGLHAPMALIDGLLQAQQFDDALAVAHTIFDPSAVGAASDTSGDNSKYWKFQPFKELANSDAKETLEKMFLQLAPQTEDEAVTAWRDDPFSPHAVARNRPVAYMKCVAMKYIEIMIAYGDYYFRQNSLETIPNAIQCYVVASHVYGPKGQKIPKRGTKKPETYASLLNRWDAFGNAVVQLELEFPFSNQTSLPIGSSNGIQGFANIFGFATSLYFCIPDNPKLRTLRETIDDRLYKIRNCMDINGVVRHLALWDPPIDPALLVAATAQGLSIDTVLNDLSGPMPNYRFQLLLQKATEMCAELKSLGAGLLAHKEKRDAETLAVLRASHEAIMASLVLDVRARQLDEASATLDQLLHSRLGPVYKLQYYKFLFGNTDPPPGEGDEFDEIANPSLKAPNAEGELLLNGQEQEEVQKSLAAQNWNIAVGAVETLAAVFNAWPTAEASAKPMGVGAGLHWGGLNLGSATSAVARGMQTYATYLASSAANAGRKGGLLRQLQDRIFQANSLGLELKNIDRQIATQRLRVATAQKEISNQEKALDQTTAVEDFLRTKYTNTELYGWLESQTKSLYQQSYNLAFDLAKRAETAFRFERPQNAATEYIRMGYWTNARDGLLAGEQLFLGLKRLEAAYQEEPGHDFELTKSVSIRQHFPLALIDFRETGTFEVSLPEILFDMDCPGHYMRRIASVAVTIPCVVGPYTSVSCTVRLLEHSIRTTPRVSSTADYPNHSQTGSSSSSDNGGEDDRFTTLRVPISATALSSAQGDTGRHEIALTDRYRPFEGAGVISRWRFQLPEGFRAFDYGTISDVVMQIRYTALDGGDRLREVAAGAVQDYVAQQETTGREGEGLYMFFDLRADFASEWYAAFGSGGSGREERELRLDNVYARLPVFTRGTAPEKILALSVVVLGREPLAADGVTLAQVSADGSDQATATFGPGKGVGDDLLGIVSDETRGLPMPMTNWRLRVKGPSANVDRLWMVVRYALTGRR
ncbi:hypothetical protein B0I37DRAFT_425036 [Chaetomium sp. MPI-CAGE-AT-0009]|nr:hypothetical protein B0I37DRAFT_425036 [Chaetomium sp. MPI-CAGE-AT-0009]